MANQTDLTIAPEDVNAVLREVHTTLRKHGLVWGAMFVARLNGTDLMLLMREDMSNETRIQMLEDLIRCAHVALETYQKVI